MAAPDPTRSHPPADVTVPATPATPLTGLLAPAVAGIAVTLALGVYGRLHEPTGIAVNVAGFSGPGYVKAWLCTLAALLAIVQLGSAMVMHGRIRVPAPPWIGGLHRWSGRLAVLATVPVAVHCLYALGFQADQPRVLAHSVLGCLFYGAFVAKMLVLSRSQARPWVLPVLGGAVFTAVVALWLTSALWLFWVQGFTF